MIDDRVMFIEHCSIFDSHLLLCIIFGYIININLAYDKYDGDKYDDDVKYDDDDDTDDDNDDVVMMIIIMIMIIHDKKSYNHVLRLL